MAQFREVTKFSRSYYDIFAKLLYFPEIILKLSRNFVNIHSSAAWEGWRLCLSDGGSNGEHDDVENDEGGGGDQQDELQVQLHVLLLPTQHGYRKQSKYISSQFNMATENRASPLSMTDYDGVGDDDVDERGGGDQQDELQVQLHVLLLPTQHCCTQGTFLLSNKQYLNL
jgi:hypothetical protein